VNITRREILDLCTVGWYYVIKGIFIMGRQSTQKKIANIPIIKLTNLIFKLSHTTNEKKKFFLNKNQMQIKNVNQISFLIN
jgi:hypothetical protein